MAKNNKNRSIKSQCNIALTPRQIEYLMNESERLGISFADFVRRIIDAHMAQIERVHGERVHGFDTNNQGD
jgi:hypothetical protein